jgi:FkbM family methyltransferase
MNSIIKFVPTKIINKARRLKNSINKKLTIVKYNIALSTKKAKHLRTRIKCKYEWYGNEKCGGFYVCPKLLNENSIVYSFGIGKDISFDKAILTKHECKLFAFDPTPKSIDWIKKQNLPPNFYFYEYGIGTKTESIDFYLPIDPDHVSGSATIQSNISVENGIKVQMNSFSDIVKKLEHNHIDVLKMDIEGSEYDVLEDLIKSEVVIDQILVEFHDRFFKQGVEKSKKTVNILRKSGYEIFAQSYDLDEISFLRIRAL